jgi:putative acetyltransferase
MAGPVPASPKASTGQHNERARWSFSEGGKPGQDGVRLTTPFILRPYQPSDEDAAIALWQRTWQLAYPAIDFAARVPWWRDRWRNQLVPNAAVVVAAQARDLVGFVTIDGTGYLDQLVVAPEHWGSKLADTLVEEAKRRSPGGVTLLVNEDNRRAIRFYERNGFRHDGEDVNPASGRPVLRMGWTP